MEQKQIEFCQRSRKYKTKYFAALKQLFGEAKDGQESECLSDRSTGTDQVCGLVGEAGHKI